MQDPLGPNSTWTTPDTHFLHVAEGDTYVVRHDTGEAEFALEDGVAVPIAEWRARRAPTPGDGKILDLRSDDGQLSMGIKIG